MNQNTSRVVSVTTHVHRVKLCNCIAVFRTTLMIQERLLTSYASYTDTCGIISISITGCTSVWSYILHLHIGEMKLVTCHIKFFCWRTIFRPSYIWERVTRCIASQSVVFSNGKQRCWCGWDSYFWRHWEITFGDMCLDCVKISQLLHCVPC